MIIRASIQILHDFVSTYLIVRLPRRQRRSLVGFSNFRYVARSSETFCINSSRVISPFPIKSFASASVYARLETRSSSIVTGFLSGSAIVAPHLITLSARARRLGGIVRPICLAVFRLITNSNFIGCSTGRSAGFVPFKILSTYIAAR
jgi:hypothetical protein